MPYEYLESGPTADATFRAWGRDLDELFTAAADAVTNLMVEVVVTVKPHTTIPVEVHAEALDLLLVRFLEELLFHKDAGQLLLRARDVRVATESGGFALHGRLVGEPIDAGRHALAADVKAVTLHGLSVEPTSSGWQAHVTVDV